MSSKKLSQEEFNGLQKSALYKIYSDLYDQKEDYRKIMEFIEKTSEADKDGKLQSTSTKAKEVSKNVRNFSPFPVPEECVNLILGSSIIARVKTETFPNDTIVQAYRGSSTEEKIKVLDQYSQKKLKCVIIQDGTNSILKKIYSTIDEFSAKYEELIALITAKFSPESIVICEIPPILNNEDANDKIDHYNRFLNEMYGSTTGFEVLNLNSNIKSLESYQSLYFDTIHLNDELGIPFLRNCLGSYVFKHSSKLPRIKPAPDYTGKANSNQKLLSNYQPKNVYRSTNRPYSNDRMHPYGRQTGHGRQTGQNNFNNKSWGCDNNYNHNLNRNQQSYNYSQGFLY